MSIKDFFHTIKRKFVRGENQWYVLRPTNLPVGKQLDDSGNEVMVCRVLTMRNQHFILIPVSKKEAHTALQIGELVMEGVEISENQLIDLD